MNEVIDGELKITIMVHIPSLNDTSKGEVMREVTLFHKQGVTKSEARDIATKFVKRNHQGIRETLHRVTWRPYPADLLNEVLGR